MNYQQILDSDKEWMENLVNMKASETCDAELCESQAHYWFGNTSSTHCGESSCIRDLEEAYNNYIPRS